MISIIDRIMFALVIGFLVPKAAAQSDKFAKMEPVENYLMEGNPEILAGSDCMRTSNGARLDL